MTFDHAVNESAVPSSIDIGLSACKKGNFELARQMLHHSIKELGEGADKEPRLVELITNIADTYLSEGKFESAWNFYMKAFQRLEMSQSLNSLPAAALMSRLAEISVLQDQMGEFAKQFDRLQRAYLTATETDASQLLTCLIDLSWSLCVKGQTVNASSVNKLIAQIKQLEKEEI